MGVSYEVFRGMLTTWRELFDQAAHFATGLGPSRVLCVSHSDAGSDGVVTVWYDSTGGAPKEDRRNDGDRGPALRYEVFRGALISWGELFQQAAEFASGLETDRLLGISHSCHGADGVVTVWYWE